MKKIKAVIFDMDGVIFDSESIWKIMYEEANEKYNISLSEEYRQSICGKIESLIRSELRQLLPGLDVDEYRDYIKSRVKQRIDNGEFEIKKGFFEVIEYLRKNGYKTALATSSEKTRAENMFSAKGLKKELLFDACVYGNDVGSRGKPDPYIFQLAAEKLGESCNECVVVEDSINGIIAAVKGGFIPVMALDLIEPNDFCRKNCYGIIDELTLLTDVLEREV